MIIAFNFDDKKHYNKFYDFLVKYGYVDESAKIGPHMRICTGKRKILGYNPQNTPYSMVKCTHIQKDIVVNLLKDNIAFNFETEETSNNFLMFLHSIGIKGHHPPNRYTNIRIDKGDIVSSMNVKYTSDVKMADYIIDLNLNTKKVEEMNTITMPTKEQILSAASKCSQAEEVLKELFPDIFPKDLSVNVVDPISDNTCIRTSGKFKDKGYKLTSHYNWTIEDENSLQILVLWIKE